MGFISTIRRVTREKMARCFQLLKAPGLIKEFEYVDPVTDQTTYLTTTSNYSILSIGDRQFYFDRITGKFDGTGSGAQLSIAPWIELPD